VRKTEKTFKKYRKNHLSEILGQAQEDEKTAKPEKESGKEEKRKLEKKQGPLNEPAKEKGPKLKKSGGERSGGTVK